MDIEKILKEYSSQLRNFLSSRMKNKSDVDDVLQEVLIKTFRHFKKIKEPDKIKSWLYKTARTTLIDYYRKSDKYTSTEIRDIEDEQEHSEDVKMELSKCLKPFFKNLPEDYRKPLEAVELQNISQKELAQKMGISYSGLKSRVQRGRQMLYQQYKDCCEYEVDVRGGVVSFKSNAGGCKAC